MSRRAYALCVGIGTYIHVKNRNLRYAVADATTVATRLADTQRGDFTVTIATTPSATTKAALEKAVQQVLRAPERRADDLTLLYFSCHGDINQEDQTFCLLPSDASRLENGRYDPTALITIHDVARWFSTATATTIVVLLDVCHSGGAGAALQHFEVPLKTGPNYFVIGAARQDQVTRQSSALGHGVFTHCLLRAFDQQPSVNGWLTFSQIHLFVSDDISWFAKDSLTQIQSWSVVVDPNVPLVRNPQYPELSPVPPLWHVPLSRNPFFTGQEEVLAALAQHLRDEQKSVLTHPHALSGLGGIGKTQVALEYAYRHRQDYHAILWGRAESAETLITTFMTIAHVLDLPEKDEQDQTVIVDAVKGWLQDRTQWLLVLDNVEDIELINAFLPSAFRGHLLVTTRAQAMGTLVASKLEVEVMSPEIGALLVLRRAKLVTMEASREVIPEVEMVHAKKLSEVLGGLPLALDQAGAYIEKVSCSLVDYLDLYHTHRMKLLQKRGGLVGDHPESVATTWSLSFEGVERQNPAAADLLRLCAFFASNGIPKTLITGGVEHLGPLLQSVVSDPLMFNDVLGTIRAYSLMQYDSGNQTISIHRLVQAVLKDSLQDMEKRVWAERVVLIIYKALPGMKFEEWSLCEQILPHAQKCALLIVNEEKIFAEAILVLYWVGTYFLTRARSPEAGSFLQQSCTLWEEHFDHKHPEMANILSSLARWQQRQGREEEAVLLFHRALSIREQQLGSDHPDTATSLNNLAGSYNSLGKYVEAESLFRRALSIREQQLGLDHPDTATSLNNLALFWMGHGRYVEAEPLFRRALLIWVQQLGPDHPTTASCLNNLGLLCMEQKRYVEAEQLFLRALSIREQQLGPDHPNTGISLNNLASLYEEQKRYAEAEQLFMRVLNTIEDRPNAQTIRKNAFSSLQMMESKRKRNGWKVVLEFLGL